MSLFLLKILVMAVNSVGSTNLLSKYTASANNTAGGTSAQTKTAAQMSSGVSPMTKDQDLIAKQQRLIKLQSDEINNLKSQKQQSSSPGIVTGVLALIGGISLFNFLVNYKSPRRMQAEMQQAAQNMQEVIEASMRRAAQMANEADGDLVIKPKEKTKYSIRAIMDSVGKVTGKKIFDNENNRLLKTIEYYPGTKNPMTIEAYDYKKGQINYHWLRADGTRAMEEIFDLKSHKKLVTIFYKEDGKTVSKIQNT